MSALTAKRVHEHGITDEEATNIVMQRGCYELAEKAKCGLESIKSYAKEELHIPNPPLWTTDNIKNNHELRRELVLEMFAVNEEIMRQNREMREELKRRDQMEMNKADIEKSEYIRMLNEAKSWRQELAI
jgi:hypothetical protein